MLKYRIYRILITFSFFGVSYYGIMERNYVIMATAFVIFTVLVILNDRMNRKGKRKEQEKQS
ncbi:hypothetical protein [Halobacillus mangrovi]|uniref:Uncharacterized protein n=1 Tax=Halobacillus mangrovi TaxID=402384 RepID=A0A1W5ZQM1_9BACI|nr:hypothetical protein [Halobacillus mangrovi]ARI75579.1 hypothetical protein HM131_01505 [Halobacillus mangrovi]